MPPHLQYDMSYEGEMGYTNTRPQVCKEKVCIIYYIRYRVKYSMEIETQEK